MTLRRLFFAFLFVLSISLSFGHSALGAEPCSGAAPVLDALYPIALDQLGETSIRLPSRYKGEIVLTPVELKFQRQYPGLWSGALWFPNNPNIDYTLDRIEIELLNGENKWPYDFDFSEGCKSIGFSLQPGDYYRLFHKMLPALDWKQPTQVRVRVWAH